MKQMLYKFIPIFQKVSDHLTRYIENEDAVHSSHQKIDDDIIAIKANDWS